MRLVHFTKSHRVRILPKIVKKRVFGRAHFFHILSPSPWPFLVSGAVFLFLVGLNTWFHTSNYGYLLMGLFSLLLLITLWFRDIIREALFEGQHTSFVQRGIKMGMILFIVSEVMFFLAFFWAFFHSSLAPSVELGCIWPPYGFYFAIKPESIPLLNTFILLLSGASVTWAHHALISNNIESSKEGFLYTIFLAIFFTGLQYFEYLHSPFTISDGVYGSTFFMATGFHGFHVLLGTILLIVSFVRTINQHYSSKQHLGFETAAMYWHFVDVVWLFLYVFVYYLAYNDNSDMVSYADFFNQFYKDSLFSLKIN